MRKKGFCLGREKGKGLRVKWQRNSKGISGEALGDEDFTPLIPFSFWLYVNSWGGQIIQIPVPANF